jgi:hypothetical protein
LNKIFDPAFDLPLSQTGSVNFNTAEQLATNITNILRQEVDTLTLLEMYNKALTFGATLATPYSNIELLDTSNPLTALNNIAEKQTSLPTNDYDVSTPFVGRCVVGSHKLYNYLIGKNGISVVGSDRAFLTQVQGVEGYFDNAEIKNNAYKGVIFGYDYFIAPDSFLPTPVSGTIHGIATHASATTRAMTPTLTKILDNQTTFGKLLQYFRKWNVLCFRPYMVYPIASATAKIATLATPTTLANDAGTVSWVGDENAVSYQVYIDGVANGDPVTALVKDISASIAATATYKITVKAFGTGTVFANSALSAELSIVVTGT